MIPDGRDRVSVQLRWDGQGRIPTIVFGNACAAVVVEGVFVIAAGQGFRSLGQNRAAGKHQAGNQDCKQFPEHVHLSFMGQ